MFCPTASDIAYSNIFAGTDETSKFVCEDVELDYREEYNGCKAIDEGIKGYGFFRRKFSVGTDNPDSNLAATQSFRKEDKEF